MNKTILLGFAAIGALLVASSSTTHAGLDCRTKLEWGNDARYTCETGGYLVSKVRVSRRCPPDGLGDKYSKVTFSCGTEVRRKNSKFPWYIPDEFKANAEWTTFAAWTCLLEGGVATTIKLRGEKVEGVAKGVAYTCVVTPDNDVDIKIPTNSCNSPKAMTVQDMTDFCVERFMELTLNEGEKDCGNGTFAGGTFRCHLP